MEILNVLKKNLRQYGMFIALLLVMFIFTIATGGNFLTSRNLSNLFDQTGYVAILAIGMTLVLIILQIDLSVGYVCGFIGALAAIVMKTWPGIPVPFIVLGAICVGILIGLYQGFLVAKCGVPAFVVTLAGMFIFRGALLRVTGSTGTIVVANQSFNALGNGYIPGPCFVKLQSLTKPTAEVFGKWVSSLSSVNTDLAKIQLNPDVVGAAKNDLLQDAYRIVSCFHLVTFLLGLLLVAGLIYSSIKNRVNRQKYNLANGPLSLFILGNIFMSVLILFFTAKLATYRGISWTVVIVAVVLGIYHFFTNNTVLGRHIYAVGGNSEAAQLSGINVQKITMFVFCSMGALAGLAGILFTARLQSATQTAGNAFEMDAIASCYVGGVSASGGVGRVTGTIIGALVMSALTNGMNLLGIGSEIQYIVRGAILIAAVLFDVRARRMKV